MGTDEEAPQIKRARFADTVQECGAPEAKPNNSAALFASSTTGATTAPSIAGAIPNPSKSLSALAPASTSGPNKVASASGVSVAASAKPVAASQPTSAAASATTFKPSAFIADAHEAVTFRAVTAPTEDALRSEISSGGLPVSVNFLHQHFGDSEQIRGYSNLAITIWMHARTYHVWVDIKFSAKRPGADKLSDIFEGAFPSGFCRSKDEFVSTCVASVASLPDLLRLGHLVGTVPVSAAAVPMSAAAAAGNSGGKGSGPGGLLEVVVRRFQLAGAPPEVKALHARMEPLLLFTIDGAQFIEADDPQWELLLPLLPTPPPQQEAGSDGAAGGCLVLGLTTLFNFYAHPDACRMRISQVLVLSPWQGLGLGKALLKLSYDLARTRGCADLTVEDPTPNLQRVREKLEVEMMRGLPWLVAQAEKCLDAVAQGGPAVWPLWQHPTKEQTIQQDGNQQPAAKPAGVAPQPLSAAASAAPLESAGQDAAAPTTTHSGPSPSGGPSPPTQEIAAAGSSAFPAPCPSTVAAAATAGAAAGGVVPQGEGLGAASAVALLPPSLPQPLLSRHTFFAALGAVPEQGSGVPSEVEVEAEAAAKKRARERESQLGGREGGIAAMGSGVGGGGAGEAMVGVGASEGSSAVAGATSGSGGGSSSGASGGGGGASDTLVPSSAFVRTVCGELKIHKGQIQVVWEALLWTLPRALRRPGVRAALEQLVTRRIDAQHFSSTGKSAAAKRLVDIPAPPTAHVKPAADGSEGVAAPEGAAAAAGGGGGDDQVRQFFLYRPLRQEAAAATTGAGGGSSGDDESGSMTAIGRLQVTQVSPQEKSRQLGELVAERLQQLEGLAAALARRPGRRVEAAA